MNLTPLQERRLQQVKSEIIFLEKQIKKRGIGFAIWVSLACMISGHLVVYLFELLINHKSISVYIYGQSWIHFFRSWIIWMLATYFFMVRSNHQALKLKRKELQELNRKYGLARETSS